MNDQGLYNEVGYGGLRLTVPNCSQVAAPVALIDVAIQQLHAALLGSDAAPWLAGATQVGSRVEVTFGLWSGTSRRAPGFNGPYGFSTRHERVYRHLGYTGTDTWSHGCPGAMLLSQRGQGCVDIVFLW